LNFSDLLKPLGLSKTRKGSQGVTLFAHLKENAMQTMRFRRETVAESIVTAFLLTVNWAELKKNGFRGVWAGEKAEKAEDQTNQRLLFGRLSVKSGMSFANGKNELSQLGWKKKSVMRRWRMKENLASYE